ncbi:CGGC domain-containing protein [Succinispira mobilis]|uniref:CGGC domain-containing protein n=1 Tax=Succinispira mobilis TaxID=78120 RepID=UPI00036CCB86|nr:CGGC domain-containing protein [Succinispira mobilis]
MNIAILVREDTAKVCTGGGCLSAFFAKEDSFERYKDLKDINLVAFTHAGGDLDKKIASFKKKNVDVVHLSSCLRSKDPNYEALAQKLSEHFQVVGYTHGSEIGKTRQAIILDKIN